MIAMVCLLVISIIILILFACCAGSSMMSRAEEQYYDSKEIEDKDDKEIEDDTIKELFGLRTIRRYTLNNPDQMFTSAEFKNGDLYICVYIEGTLYYQAIPKNVLKEMFDYFNNENNIEL